MERKKSCKPFLKWAGGKGRLLDSIMDVVPNEYKKYYELFLGSGSLYFAIQPDDAILSDLNEDLVNTFREVKERPENLIKTLKRMSNTEDEYYSVRARNTRTPHTSAARFIYLNKLCYNGIYRVNKKGLFNVPYCRDPNRKFVDEKRILECAKSLEVARIVSKDFEEFYSQIKADDFVYLDPPYAVQKKNNGFLEYNKKIFNWCEQERLAKFAIKLKHKGAKVLVSNVNAIEVIELYEGFEVVEAYRNCGIGGKNVRRKKVKEILLKGY